ncbi:MAG: hypothetical protein IPK79_00330 [Vampirovibrionales bacterium]|nr:hypothetical protein [Vampirovibrionales bacterium]
MRTAFVATTIAVVAILGFGVFFLLFVENSIGKNGVILSIAFVGFAGVGIVILLILAATVIVTGRVFGDTVGAQSDAFAAFLKSFGQWASYMKETAKQPKQPIEAPVVDDEWTVYGAPVAQFGAPQQGRLPGANTQQHQLPVFPDELPAQQQARSAASEVMVR